LWGDDIGDAYQELAQRPTDHGVNVEVHVFAILLLRLGFPVIENRVATCVDFFNVVVHVLNEQDVVVERLLVFGVTLALGAHDRRRLLSDDLQALKHGLVDARVGVVDHSSNLQLLAVACRRQHVLNGDGEVWECLHKGNHALALLDLDFSIFNRSDLLVEETAEETLEPLVDLLQGTREEVLVRVFDIDKLAVDSRQDSNSLPGWD
jgi:hypothetical protein